MIRDVLNYLGEKVGELELPDGTSEEVWAAKLAPYAVAPTTLVPQIVTPRQIRLGLIAIGKPLQSVTDAIAMLPSPYREMAEVEWEYATEIERSNELVNMVAAADGMSSEEVNALFELAATL